MATDKMYELAFEYKKTKLWKRLWDNELFAVRFSDGVIGYCRVVGMVEQMYAVMVYLGEKGFDSYRFILSDKGTKSEFEYREQILSQDCLRCILDEKGYLSPEEIEEVRQYAKKQGIALRGQYTYPHFNRLRPNYYPWHLDDEKEQGYLCEALEASVFLAKNLELHTKEEVGLKEIEEDTEEILMLEKKEDGYVFGRTKIPAPLPIQYPRPKMINDLQVAKLKKKPKRGTWECEVVRMLSPVQEDREGVPYFPVLMFAVESGTGYVLPVSPAMYYEEKPEDLLSSFIETLLEEKICPSALFVRNEKTYVLLEELCRKAKIPLKICEELPYLDLTEEDFLKEFDSEGQPIQNEEKMRTAEEMLDYLLSGDISRFDDLPDILANQLLTLADFGVLSEGLSKKIRKIFASRKKKDGGKKKKKNSAMPEQSYVISVSLYAGCYRHIQISSKKTLLDLHQAILDAFEFCDEDHEHAFFMDNVRWSQDECYFSRSMEGEKNTGDYKLEEMELEPGKKFKYLFDFGDEWMFQCRVLSVLEEKTPKTLVKRRKGAAPEQYPDWEDGED